MVTGGKAEYAGGDASKDVDMLGGCGSSHLINQHCFQRIPHDECVASDQGWLFC